MSKGGNDSGVMAPGPMSGDPPLEVADRGFTLAVYANPAALAHATAVYVMERAFRAVRGRGFFGLALAGGSTPEATYRLLAGAPFSASMPWGSTDVFWTDERCVDPLDRRSNEHMAREALLDHVPVDLPRRSPPSRVRTRLSVPWTWCCWDLAKTGTLLRSSRGRARHGQPGRRRRCSRTPQRTRVRQPGPVTCGVSR
jgi:hypothetical protein